jgi:hypothetical protein
VFNITSRSHESTRLIPTNKLGQTGNRGTWATAASKDGEFGVMLGVTQGADYSAGIFIPEARFAEFRQSLPENFREVFEEAVQRLPEFKLRRGRSSNGHRA